MNKEFARDLRKRQTEAEKKIWFFLRDRKFEGLKFRRQHPIGDFIVDFCCPEKNLIIEVDGSQHVQNQLDDQRTECLKQKGFKVLRFWNNDVLNKCHAVLELIKIELTPHPNPLPDGERGV